MKDEDDPATIQFAQASKDIAAIVAELIATQSAKTGSFGLSEVLEGVGGMLGATYNLACLGGEDGKIAYVHLLRKHADAVEASL